MNPKLEVFPLILTVLNRELLLFPLSESLLRTVYKKF